MDEGVHAPPPEAALNEIPSAVPVPHTPSVVAQKATRLAPCTCHLAYMWASPAPFPPNYRSFAAPTVFRLCFAPRLALAASSSACARTAAYCRLWRGSFPALPRAAPCRSAWQLRRVRASRRLTRVRSVALALALLSAALRLRLPASGVESLTLRRCARRCGRASSARPPAAAEALSRRGGSLARRRRWRPEQRATV